MTAIREEFKELKDLFLTIWRQKELCYAIEEGFSNGKQYAIKKLESSTLRELADLCKIDKEWSDLLKRIEINEGIYNKRISELRDVIMPRLWILSFIYMSDRKISENFGSDGKSEAFKEVKRLARHLTYADDTMLFVILGSGSIDDYCYAVVELLKLIRHWDYKCDCYFCKDEDEKDSYYRSIYFDCCGKPKPINEDEFYRQARSIMSKERAREFALDSKFYKWSLGKTLTAFFCRIVGKLVFYLLVIIFFYLLYIKPIILFYIILTIFLSRMYFKYIKHPII